MKTDPYRDWLRIESEDRPLDYYALLGLPRFTDDRDAIDQKFRNRSREVKRYALGPYSRLVQDLLDELAQAMVCLTHADRKAEYDESLGRQVHERPARWIRSFEQVLLDWRAVSPEQLDRAKALAQGLGVSLREIVCRSGMVSQELAARATAQAQWLPYLDLSELSPRPDLLKAVPNDLLRKYQVFPVTCELGVVVVACADPSNLAFEEPLRLAVGMPIRLAVASPLALHTAIDRWIAASRSLAGHDEHRAMTGQSAAQWTHSACVGHGASTVVDQPSAGQILRLWFWNAVEKSLSHPLISLLVVTISLAAALAAT